MNCHAERQFRWSTLCKITYTEKTFNVLCFDFLRLHRNKFINYNTVVNKVILMLNDDWCNGSLVQNVIVKHPVWHIPCRWEWLKISQRATNIECLVFPWFTCSRTLIVMLTYWAYMSAYDADVWGKQRIGVSCEGWRLVSRSGSSFKVIVHDEDHLCKCVRWYFSYINRNFRWGIRNMFGVIDLFETLMKPKIPSKKNVFKCIK
jgi:hypothetical protein